jgi:hypothetical protein
MALQLGLKYVRFSQVKGTARLMDADTDLDDAAVNVRLEPSCDTHANGHGGVAGAGISDVAVTLAAPPGTIESTVVAAHTTIRSSMPFAAASLVWENLWYVLHRPCGVSFVSRWLL